MPTNGETGKMVAKGRCPYCNASVKGENLPRHLRSVHPGKAEAVTLARKLETEARRSQPRAQRVVYRESLLASKAFLVLVVVALVVVGGVAAYVYVVPHGPDPEYTEPLTQICYGAEQLAYHRHVLLHITINNQSMTIPQGIGLTSAFPGGLDTCVRPVHTHDATGQIHIESRILRSYTLGEFFDLWAQNQPNAGIRLDQTHLMNKDTSQGGTIQVVANGQARTDFRATPLVDLNTSSSTDPGHIFITYTGP